ncbi:hypothetical protein [Lysinibacillus sp. NPDC047702]|uniref:hypothetical protein n=1 Tax=unclassified Lysinibacillus TaxID=2636778 RepID=UPI003D03186E
MKKEIYWNLFFAFILFFCLLSYYLLFGIGGTPINEVSKDFASLSATILFGIAASIVASVGLVKGGKSTKTRLYVIRILYEVNFVLLACIVLFFASYSKIIIDDYAFISILLITMSVLIFDMLRYLRDILSQEITN